MDHESSDNLGHIIPLISYFALDQLFFHVHYLISFSQKLCAFRIADFNIPAYK